MDKDKLKEIIEKHKLWRETYGEKGERANLLGANLSGADLLGANLLGANLSGADLLGANLSRADLSGADLFRANLSDANLLGANLSGANLLGADLFRANLLGANLLGVDLSDANLLGANLLGANLLGANLSGANLLGANLLGANLLGARNLYFFHIPEEGAFIAFKKVHSSKGYIILKLEIPASAKRTSSIIGRKNRASKAKVLAWLDGEKWNKKRPDFKMYSNKDYDFIYEIGKTVSVDDFNDDPRIECAPGIHFFTMLQEAKDYNL